MINKIISLFILAMTIQGCNNNFKNTEHSYFKKRWDDSSKHSVVSWWYFGKKNNTHYIMEKWVIDKYYYKVKEQNFTITFNNKERAFKATDPINLKSINVNFD